MYKKTFGFLLAGLFIGLIAKSYNSDLYDLHPRFIITFIWFAIGLFALVKTYQLVEFGIVQTIIANATNPMKYFISNLYQLLIASISLVLIILLINVFYKNLAISGQAYGLFAFTLVALHTIILAIAFALLLRKLSIALAIFIFSIWFLIETMITNQACGFDHVPSLLFALPFAGIRIALILKQFSLISIVSPIIWVVLSGLYVCSFLCKKVRCK
ncbi:MAG: hypothetical protein GXO48_01115 [Chlorobi bacterium]|nr:hypothetical protein [Chlorobiota bacterium]